MIKERMIGCVPVEVDIREANEVYFEKKYADLIEEPGISGVISMIYNANGSEHLPLSVFIELTNRCNFACPFCYINEEGVQHSSVPSFNELKNTLDYLIDKGLLYCVLTGGECLLHPSFTDIYRYLKELGVLVTVFTNGYLLDKGILDLFCEYKPFKIEISLYGIDDYSYRTTTKVASVCAQRVFDNVLALKNAGINEVCKTPITSLTESSYEQIEQWCKENEISFYSGTELMNTYSGEERNPYLASTEIRERFRTESDAQFLADESMQKFAFSEKKQRINFDCSAGRTDVMIDSQYNLLPCMKAAWLPQWKFDIKAMGIKTAYEQLVEKINSAKGTPLRYCVGCEHNGVCQECFMTQYEHEDLRTHRLEYCKSLKRFFAENKH